MHHLFVFYEKMDFIQKFSKFDQILSKLVW